MKTSSSDQSSPASSPEKGTPLRSHNHPQSNSNNGPLSRILQNTEEMALALEQASVDTGMDCFADDRDALNDLTKYYANVHLSDITLVVGEDVFPAHRIILSRSSEVFDRMLSNKWQHSDKSGEVELTEEPQCQMVFGSFLRFLYSNHIVLNPINALPILVLADKYGVGGLKKICIDYAVHHCLPELDPRELFHTYFSYATRSFHPPLIDACMEVLSSHFVDIIDGGSDWERDWLATDRDQLLEFLKSSHLQLPNEFVLWEAVQRWLRAPSHPERRTSSASVLSQVLPLIRFPYMTADELAQVEQSPLAQQHPKLFMAYTHPAFKFISMPLASRALNSKEFSGIPYLLREYRGGDVRWEARFIVTAEQMMMYERNNQEHTFKFSTRSNSLSLPQWQWSLGFCIGQGPPSSNSNSGQNGSSSSSDDSHQPRLRLTLTALDVDHTNRSVEYLLMFVNDSSGGGGVMRMVAGTRMFTKARYSSELDLQGTVQAGEVLAEDSPLLTKGQLHLQLILRPII